MQGKRSQTFEAAGWKDWWQVLPPSPNHTIAGTVKIGSVSMPHYGHDRRLWLRLPSSYFDTPDSKRYKVIVMLDGQNIFDRVGSFDYCEWQVDETLLHLEKEGIEGVVLSIENAPGNRGAEYGGWEGTPEARALLHLITDTILPDLATVCRIGNRPEETFIAGASLGAAYALWAWVERPDVFGGCAAFSPAQVSVMKEVLSNRALPAGKVYLDHGDLRKGVRAGGDRGFGSSRLYQLFRKRGFLEGKHLLYNPKNQPGQPHHESAWAQRFPSAARFMLAA